ncbi:MAG TPA: NYN domain-containing protein [Anaerolineae bacterium]|nr:NYN domain-containing protein [Anaerolineae bacterium]
MQRVIAYVDGYNLYYGLHDKRWKRFYWLNIQAVATALLKPNQTLIETKYFTTIVKRPADKNKRQMVFIEALQTLKAFQIYYGHFLSDTVRCRNCGHTYETHHEKMTDVNMSVELMADAFQDRFDVALIISADSDLVGPVYAVRKLFTQKRVVVAFPPGRSSEALKRAAHAQIYINRDVLAKSIFPDEITKSDGFVLRRPTEWH